MDDASSSSSSSSSSSRGGYDVFLSFRGEDTRNNFTGHLYDALRRKGINAFIDADKLRRGQLISPSLLTAIESSTFSIVVLSENYASSRWCLVELVKILDCMKTRGQRVLPIFHNVDPADVRNHRENFGDALNKHCQSRDPEEVQVWRDALTEVANLSGWDSRNRHEPSLIKEIVGDVFNRLLAITSSDAGDLVGIDSHFRKMKSLLAVGSNDVRFIGIWGMGGIGKTTIARFVYDQLSKQFETHCFLSNVREELEKHGLVQLQKELLSHLLEEETISISTVDHGLALIKTRLCFKSVLIVIDDAQAIQQLEYLVGKRDWFGPGSRIIITTRDLHLLDKIGVNGVYEVEKLNDNDALKLFSQYAFNEDHPTEVYMELSNNAVSYAQGLPLALKVLGSSLFGRSEREWRSQIDKLKMNPHVDIESVLLVSFDGLDDKEKDIFLDVACFFKGEDKDFVIAILDGCGFFPDIGIRVLLDKALIVLVGKKLWMHDLLQEMGWDIVCRTSHRSPRERNKLDPEKRTRLWSQEDVYDVLTQKTATKSIEGIFMDLKGLTDIHFTTEAFAEMKKLRLLKVYNSDCHNFGAFECMCAFRKKIYKEPLPQDFEFPSSKLSYLYWSGCPLQSLPSNFHPKNLVELNLCCSNIEELWQGVKALEKLKFLYLTHSQFLKKIPNLSRVTNLERVVLEGSNRLCAVDPSLAHLKKLIFLSLRDCTSLTELPSSLELESLQILNLSGCSNLRKFPEIRVHMKDLSELYLDGTAMEELPSSVGLYATGLVVLNLRNCKGLKSLPNEICHLESLQILNLSGCSNLRKFPEIKGLMKHLSELYLDGTAIQELPSSVGLYATGLVVLDLRNCKGLKSLPNEICDLKSLQILQISDCSKLESLPNEFGKLKGLRELEADRTPLRGLPDSFVDLRFTLQQVSFSGFKTSFSIFTSWLMPWKRSNSFDFLFPQLSTLGFLTHLKLRDCKIVDGMLLNSLCLLSSLRHLDLSGNNFERLPSNFNQLSQLMTLDLGNCKSLQEIPVLPSSLHGLYAPDCISLRKIPNLPWNLNCIRLNNCLELEDDTSIIKSMLLPGTAKDCWHENIGKAWKFFSATIPGSRVPDWFSHRNNGRTVFITPSPNQRLGDCLGFAICVVLHPIANKFPILTETVWLEVKFYCFGRELNDHHELLFWDITLMKSQNVCVGYFPCSLPELCDSIKFSLWISKPLVKITGCGVRLIYAKDVNTQICTPQPSSSVIIQELENSLAEGIQIGSKTE